jgi:hypothetical protein
LVPIATAVGGIVILTSLGFAQSIIQTLSRSHFLAVQSVLPTSDHELASLTVRDSTTRTFTALLGWVSFPTSLFVFKERAPVEILYALGLGLVLWLTTISSTVLILRFLSRMTRPGVIGVLVLSAMFVSLAMFTAAMAGWVAVEDICTIVNFLNPAGWVILMLLNLLEPNPDPSYWFWGIPICVLIVIGLTSPGRFVERYDITNLEPQSDGSMQASDARHLTLSFVEPIEELEELERHVAREYVRQELNEFRYEFEISGWIERKIWSMLDTDERASLLAISPIVPEWTRQMIRMTAIVGIALVCTLVLSLFVTPDAVTTAVFCWLAASLLLATVAVYGFRWSSSNSQSCTSTILLPVSDHHLNRIAMLLGTCRAIAFFPLAWGAGMIISFANGNFGFLASLLFAGKCCLVYLAMHQRWFTLLQAYDMSQKGNSQQSLDMLLGLTAVGGAILLFLDDDNQLLSLLGTLLLFGASHLAYMSFRHAKVNGPMDFVCKAMDDFDDAV